MDEIHASVAVEISLELTESRNLQPVQIEVEPLVELLIGDKAKRSVSLLSDDVELEADADLLRRQGSQSLEHREIERDRDEVFAPVTIQVDEPQVDAVAESAAERPSFGFELRVRRGIDR